MELLYATGIRHAEAHKLDLYDADTAAYRLTVQTSPPQPKRGIEQIEDLPIDQNMTKELVGKDGQGRRKSGSKT